MPLHKDKRTGKYVIQYQTGYKYVPDKDNPGQMLKRPKYKSEVIGTSKNVAKEVLKKREGEQVKKKY
ncbi:MAG: hypothetical protein HQK57_15800 [Deltaproteobacteria bacterium]|nr:hypothetical protein [Deltaproteobacteria bacterium]